VAQLSGTAARRVNTAVDGVASSPYYKNTVSAVVSAEKRAERIARPYLQPLDPYVATAKPFVLPAATVALAVAAPPICIVCAIIAFFTSPFWLTVGFFTAFIWVPVVCFLSAVGAVLGLVFALRVGSSKRAQESIRPVWNFIAGSSLGQAVFYCARA